MTPTFRTGILLFLVWQGSALAAPPSLRLEDLTWTELQTAIRGGDTTIIVPIGGVEQSGPAIALGKHNVRAAALAIRIATVLGNALVAPSLIVPELMTVPALPPMKMPFKTPAICAVAAFVTVPPTSRAKPLLAVRVALILPRLVKLHAAAVVP